jgi:hypothetical protein
MMQRFEILTFANTGCQLRFYCARGALLLRSEHRITTLDMAGLTIEWLRSAVHKDWLYRIGRERMSSGPLFRLRSPNDVVCTSRTYYSSDAMEHAITALKADCPKAPVHMHPASSPSLTSSSAVHPPGARYPVAANTGVQASA